MELQSTAKKTGQRLLRWWMIPLCLVASWLCWWGVNKWLEPKPLWSRVLPDRGYCTPQAEDSEGNTLLAAEFLPPPVGSDTKANAFIILDRLSGKELYRTSVNESLMSDSDGNNQFIPRFVDDVVWRVSRLIKNNTVTHSLHCWNYTRGTEEQVVHTWKDNLGLQTNIFWPAKSRIILVRQQLPIELLAVTSDMNPLRFLCCMQLYQQGLLAMPAWYESWKLPDAGGQPPQFLARWNTHRSHWHRFPVVSEDGQYAAFPESWGNEVFAATQGKAMGKASFQGEELFNLFRSEMKGIQFINTSTGKVQHHFVDKGAHHSLEFLQGNRFITRSFQPSPAKSLSLKEIEEGAADRNRNVYSNSFAAKQRFYQLTADGIREMRCAEELQGDGIQFYSFCSAVYGMKRGADSSTHYQVSFEGDQVTLLRSLTIPSELSHNWAIWFGKTNQCLHQQPSPYGQWYRKLQGKWGWLDSFLHKFRTYLRLDSDIVVTEQRPGSSLQHAFQQVVCHDFLSSYSCLYLMQIAKKDQQPVSITLNAYALPLQLYSPWWGRGMACLPVIILLVLVMRRKQA